MKIRQVAMLLYAFGAVLSLSACSGGGGGGGNGTNGINGNTAPIANAGIDQKVTSSGIQVVLDGTGSSDPDGGTPTYAWSFTVRPVGSMAALSSSIVSSPTFTPDKAGKYELTLVVNDGIVNSPADTVIVRAGMPVPDTGQTRWYSTAFGDDGDIITNSMSYMDNGNGTITDNVTGLVWQKQDDSAKRTLSAATAYCSGLSLAGSGWRIPTRLELQNIADYGTYNPAINGNYFPATQSDFYWSSTLWIGDPAFAWLVTFATGNTGGYPVANSYYVRCVR